ncbi:hypothetical protein IV203_026073 [Nitzschia inconspicua]|uniref:Uncharacterized protein n=1 Tax=Nitzschia inconspicua TaxID=303405 RepID=A0A9K3PWW9_9STRA|nr:hypothetical protein IV203_026073 [Nitzschia inconspicua]
MKVNPALLHKLEENKKILSTSMDGPSVSFAPNDLLKFNNNLFLLYHVMGSGYDYLTPIGCIIGGLALPMIPKFKDLTRLQAAGTGAIYAGGAGMGLGFLALMNARSKKEPKFPFDEAGMQNRVDGLTNNYRVRCMDLGVWLGVIAAGATLAYKRDPTMLGLSSGTFGRVQAVGLGSATASVLTNVYIAATK